jgi:hypothetical protein
MSHKSQTASLGNMEGKLVSTLSKLHLSLLFVALACYLASFSPVSADPIPQVTSEPGMSSQRNVRYCEIIPIYRSGLKLHAEVYNTLGLNDCPTESWNALSGTTLAKNLGAFTVNMNGPRYWVLDEIEATGGVSEEGLVTQFGDLEMAQRAVLDLSWSDLKQAPYTPRPIDRDTRYTFYAGHEIYELVSPKGDVFIMQSYSQIIDPTLTLDDLDQLGERLDLPRGWTYQTRILEADFELLTVGQATVIQDDLLNSYQKIAP